MKYLIAIAGCTFFAISGQKFKISPSDVTVHPDFKIEEMLKAGNELLLVRLPEAATTFLEDKQARKKA